MTTESHSAEVTDFMTEEKEKRLREIDIARKKTDLLKAYSPPPPGQPHRVISWACEKTEENATSLALTFVTENGRHVQSSK